MDYSEEVDSLVLGFEEGRIVLEEPAEEAPLGVGFVEETV